ncbi:hypothetical protein E8E13_002538 [Curvularia kusanoi]|uniref:T6SS Phospholipase effector Tle1-like catalytic domain-containing protein n=1 Tax=Curvularia kusanoi TaxID=90978 RepID=A0A9P4TCQ4_CURKU|nr:hypothetical protein E8E13_002538 [Curvularia kusanoi]
MLRISAEHLTYPDTPLFAAFQAHLIYCMLLFFHFPALSKPFRRQAMMDLQILACASSRGGLVCIADKTGAVPEWNSWVLAEAKRRTLYISGKHNLPSNVTRIARTLAKAGKEGGKVWQQIVYYDSGVGSGSLSAFESKRQGATGDGLVVNVLEAYNFVVNNYSPGDKIYCFGFSRGAFTARAVAGMITDFGVIKPDSMRFFATLFAAYQTNTKKYTFRKTKEYFEWLRGKGYPVPESQKETISPYPKVPWYDMGAENSGFQIYENSRSIELVGVFDTVGSLGMADSYVHSHASSRQVYEWLNVKWNPYIKHAFHALALDDRRQPFLPTLYYIPSDATIKEENRALEKDEEDWPELIQFRKEVEAELQKEKEDEPDLAQVWFTGVHINVGGGTDKSETDFEGLANITFAWMIEQCRPYLAFDEFTNASLANYLSRMVEDATEQELRNGPPKSMVNKTVATITDPIYATASWLSSWVSAPPPPPKEKLVRTYCVSAEYCPKEKPEHWTLFRKQDSYTRMYKFISSPADRTPGACDDRSTETHTPLYKLGKTNEWMHPSVWWRREKSQQSHIDENYKYKSAPLLALKYGKEKEGVYGWSRYDAKEDIDVWIPEWPIEAALGKRDRSTYNENAELAVLDMCLDEKEARKALREHATAWNQADISVKSKANATSRKQAGASAQ